MRRIALLFALVLTVGTPDASSACTAAGELSALHAQYAALMAGQSLGDEAIPAFDAVDVVRRITDEGATADISALARIASDVSHLLELAQNGPAETQLSPRARSEHLDNLQQLQSWISATDCPTDLSVPDTLATEMRALDQPPQDESVPEQASDPFRTSPIGLASLVGLPVLIAAGAFVFRKLNKSSDLRQEKRVTVSFETTFLIAGEIDPHTARAVDLSRTGLKIETTAGLPSRTRITLSIDDLVLTASVVWSNAYFAGLRLSEPLDEDTFAKLKAL